MQDPESTLSIDRAHRKGKFEQGKTRPIVAKFKDTASLLQTSQKSNYNVSDQYLTEVKERRKELITAMLKARSK
ncbi:hypothetical protein MAR_010603, partial [Mya arenaria]